MDDRLAQGPLGRRLVSLASRAPSGALLLLRYLPRIWHVLRTEGQAVLRAKIQRRLHTTPISVPRRPELVTRSRPYPPLLFAGRDAPAVSVIIPVHDKYVFTYHCLVALARHAYQRPFEPLVVDDCSTDETQDQLAGAAGIKVIRNDRNLGFVASCNRGAEAASGEYLVFLNNDTQVQPGWLDALVGTFEDRPDAGLVGSRLIYPDGRQQEAGAILSADGSAWNYGHLGRSL